MNAFCLWIRRALQARPLALAIATIPVALAIVFVFAIAPTAVMAQGPTAPSGCELVLNVSWTQNASIPQGGELAVPAPPAHARIFCVDSIESGETGSIELRNGAVFTATVGTTPVVLNISGANLAAALSLNETEQGYGVLFAPQSPVPSIKILDGGTGLTDVRLFWGSPKTAAGKPVGQLGTWRKFELGATPTEIGWAEGQAREFRLKASSLVTVTLAGGDNFAVKGPATTPTCTRLGCTLEMSGFTAGIFTVTPAKGGWVSVEVSGLVGSTVELWVPAGTTAAPAAVTATKVDPKGGGGFPATYLPLLTK